MSTDTPEAREKSIYQLRREAIARAVEAWQDADDDQPAGPYTDADEFVDCLSDEGLQILPRAVAYGKWMVLVDGEPACYPGQDRQAGPVDAEQAAEMFLLEVSKAESVDRSREITVRPATDGELVSSAWEHITGGGV